MSDKWKIAIVHDYLNQMGGAERVVGVLHRMFPDAPIYTTIADRERLLPELRDADIRTTWMQKIPGILKRFKLFFWLYPLAVESMDLRDYDLVISSSSAYAKGAPIKGNTIHVCYCHTPMRFAWDFSSYMEGNNAPALQKMIAKAMVSPLRLWDRLNARRVNHIVANSTIVQKRIADCYGRESNLIYPPVNISRFAISDAEAGDYFLVVSRLVSYKRIDLAVEACTRLGKKLVVIGDGPDRKRLESLAGQTVTFLGHLPDEQVVQYMQQCSAFIFPGIEDFGITPLEVNACGRPVVAFQGGGALDTVIPDVNGVYFIQQTADSLVEGLERLAQSTWDPVRIRKHAEQFSEKVFMNRISEMLEQITERRDLNETRVAFGRIG